MQNETFTTFHSGAAAEAGMHGMAESFARFSATVAVWKRRHQTRRMLAVADTRTLTDVGLSEADRLSEVKKFFWEE